MDKQREQFEAKFKHLNLEKKPDALGVQKYVCSHVEAIWYGWLAAQAASGEARCDRCGTVGRDDERTYTCSECLGEAGMTDARLLELLEQHASHLIRYAPDWLPLLRAIVNETITTVSKVGETLSSRPCTCHPADNPPQPCEQKYALTECRIARTFEN